MRSLTFALSWQRIQPQSKLSRVMMVEQKNGFERKKRNTRVCVVSGGRWGRCCAIHHVLGWVMDKSS
jgi:hypothetical protein